MRLASVSMTQMGFRINSRKINMRKPMTHSTETFAVIKDKYFFPNTCPQQMCSFYVHSLLYINECLLTVLSTQLAFKTL